MTPPHALAVFQQTDWSAVPVERVTEHISRQMVYGERVMVCRLVIAAGTVTPVHSHMHEQITLVERGRVDFFVEGERRPAKAGDVFVFPANIQHGATMLDEEVVLVDIFSPPREDFLPSPRLSGEPR
jgi:quercetin dioxygenase-like cupin family protein